MNRHLSSEEISNWISGEPNAQVERHTHYCPVCQADLDSFSTAMSLFVKSARGWADLQRGSDAPTIRLIEQAPRRATVNAISWAAIATLVCVLACFSARQSPRADTTLETDDTDTSLLRQVDAEVSQTVPASMEPLTRLMSSEPTVSAAKPHRRERRGRTTRRKAAI